MRPQACAPVPPGRIVDIDVLQQLGSEAVVGLCAGQNLHDSAVF